MAIPYYRVQLKTLCAQTTTAAVGKMLLHDKQLTNPVYLPIILLYDHKALVRRWDVVGGQRDEAFELNALNHGGISCYVILDLNNNDEIATGTEDGHILIWSINAKNCIVSFREKHPCEICCAKHLLARNEIASASQDGTVIFWDRPTGKRLMTLSHPNTAITTDLECFDNTRIFHINLEFSPNGNFLASASCSVIVIWHLCEEKVFGKKIFPYRYDNHILQGTVPQPMLVRFSEDAQSIAIAQSYDLREGEASNQVRLFDVATGTCIYTLQSNHEIYDMTFNCSASYLGISSIDNSLGIIFEDWKIAPTLEEIDQEIAAEKLAFFKTIKPGSRVCCR